MISNEPHTSTSQNTERKMMTTTRKHLRITITGETYGDLVEALEEVHRKVEEEYLSGFDRNETGDYEFDITESAK
jgi:uncharacterized protein (DUF169 family)